VAGGSLSRKNRCSGVGDDVMSRVLGVLTLAAFPSNGEANTTNCRRGKTLEPISIGLDPDPDLHLALGHLETSPRFCM
jgi:hypothetical protein